jgi:hypothetical protein
MSASFHSASSLHATLNHGPAAAPVSTIAPVWAE